MKSGHRILAIAIAAMLAGGMTFAGARLAAARPGVDERALLAALQSRPADAPARLTVQTAPVPEPSKDTTLTLQGHGKVKAVPDIVVASLGVEARGSTPGEALTSANASANKVISSLKRDGVAAEDISTSDLSLYPSQNSKGTVTGYSSSNMVSARIHALKRVGAIIGDALAAAGSHARMQGISYDIESRAALLRRARERAVHDVMDKARQYARLTNRSLGRIRSISEDVDGPDYYSGTSGGVAMYGGAVADAPPIEIGTLDIEITTRVVFELR